MDPVILIFFLAFVLPGGISYMAQIPAETWKLMLHPRHFKMELKAKKQLRAIESSRKRVEQLAIEHKDSLKEVQESRNAELDHFDWQLFEIERPAKLKALVQKTTHVLDNNRPVAEIEVVRKEVSEAWNWVGQFSNHENYPSEEVVGTLNVISDLAHALEDRRDIIQSVERHKKQAELTQKKAIEAQKQAAANAPVPYMPSVAQTLDVMEAVKDKSVGSADTVAAVKKFLGKEWDPIAFYFDDDATLERISQLMAAKVARAYTQDGWDEAMQKEMEKRILSCDNPQEYLRIWEDE